MSAPEGRGLLDRLEAHVLSPRFRYDHAHAPGDLTIWSNYMTLHNSTPSRPCTADIADARLMYRLSCKGEPALRLPRIDDPAWLRQHIALEYTTPPEILAA
jgi:alpha-ketoglutarate-dependent taurine dioxygenase